MPRSDGMQWIRSFTGLLYTIKRLPINYNGKKLFSSIGG